MAAPLILKIIVFSVAKKVTVYLIAKVSAIFRDFFFFFFFFTSYKLGDCRSWCKYNSGFVDILLHGRGTPIPFWPL